MVNIKNEHLKLGMMLYVCNPRTLEAEAGELQSQSQSESCSERMI